jgi:hypothetical protein
MSFNKCFSGLLSCVVLFQLSLTSAAANAPIVERVRIEDSTIYVTISHPDTGWEHYADGWEVLDAQGNRLGLRELVHPHVNEQPFTRSLNGIVLPDGTDVIFIRTRDVVHGWSDDTYEVKVPQ